MSGIVLILIMVFLVTLWIMGAYVDVKNTHRQNGHNSGSELVKTEIIQKDSQKRKLAFHDENIEKEGMSGQCPEETVSENVSLRGARTLLSLPAGQALQEDNPLPEPDPVDIPRERMRVLRTFREEEPVPEFEESHDSLILDSSPENTGNSPAVLDSMTEEEFETAPVHHKDESIQTEHSLENQATQTHSNKRDIGVDDPLLTEDAAIQVAPEKQDAEIGELLPAIDISIQANPEKEDQSIQALPSRHDVSLGSHISQHEQGVQHDLSTHSIGIDPSSLLVEEKSVQAEKSLRNVSLQNSLIQRSHGVGSHISYNSKKIQASPVNQDEPVQHSRTFKSIGLDPRSFHASDFSSVVISEEDNSPSSRKSSFKSENILDKIPLAQSLWIEEQEKQPLFKIPAINLNDVSLAESIYPESEHSVVESILLQSQSHQNSLDQPPGSLLNPEWDPLSRDPLKRPVGTTKPEKQPDSDDFSILPSQKSLHSHGSWELLEEKE